MSAPENENVHVTFFSKIIKFVQYYKNNEHVKIFVRDYLCKLIVPTGTDVCGTNLYLLKYDTKIMKNFVLECCAFRRGTTALEYGNLMGPEVIDECTKILSFYDKNGSDYLDFITKFIEKEKEEMESNLTACTSDIKHHIPTGFIGYKSGKDFGIIAASGFC